ncbi:MAG: hypothetical protein GY940_30260, partial [bacterium]|nr:hypothetical protein [bacterium]
MKRTLFYSIISLYLALFLLSLMFPSPHLSTAETALLNVFIFGVVSVSTFYSFKYEKILSPLFIMTVFFVLVIWTGFHFIFSDLDAIRDATAVPEISTDTFQKAYYVILAGFVSFVGGYILVSTVSITTGKEKRTGNIIETNNGEFPNNRARFAISVIIAGMLTLKVLSQVFFNIGIAGVRPVSIPFGGVISFASKFGPMIGICLLFALELKRKNRFYRFLLLLFIASYVGLEILAVWKSAHLKIFLLLAVIYFSARGFKQLNLRSLSILLAVVVASMLLYTTVWEYRKVLKNYQIQRYESVPKRDQPGPVESVKNIHHRLAGGVINFFHALEYDKH